MLHFLAILLTIIGGLWLWDYVFPPPPPPIFPQNSTALMQLTDAELSYYRQVFDYTMAVTKSGERYEWKSEHGRGFFAPSDPFTSKSGSTCRKFTEEYEVGSQSATLEGVACKREGREGWCRLKKTDAQTCAMEPPLSATDKAARGTQGALEAAKGILGKAQGLLR